MPATNATSSPRDATVDANPDLARKKQRLSEDDDGNDSAAEDTVLIEACEPEDIGASLDTAIEIEDDMSMPLYSDTFRPPDKAQPLEHVDKTLREIAGGQYYLQVDTFKTLSNWLHEHLKETLNDPPEVWQQQYLDLDSEFFARFGQLTQTMLTVSDLFEAADINKPGMKAGIQGFFVNICELSCRFITLLPVIITSILSRRDSAVPDTAVAHPVELFLYINVALQSLPAYSDIPRSCKRLALDTAAIHSRNVHSLSQPLVVQALGTVVKLLGGAMRQIKDSWLLLHNTLKLFTHVLREASYASFPDSVFEEIMEVLKACILPAICAKHPGALPEGFHMNFIETGKVGLLRFSQEHDQAQAEQVYLRFVKSDEEAIVSEGVSDDSISTTLADISQNDVGALGQLFATSWIMQASIAYVRSDIMNVRNIGLHVLKHELRTAYDHANKSGDLEDIFVQHAIRFLRKNEITKYIFSPDSHASLISESCMIVSFLTETGTYTDQETDVIWRACTTSVEADFVKASFWVLEQQLGFLDFRHVLYILQKYAKTPIDSLSAAAAGLLPKTLMTLERFYGATFDQKDRLRLAFAIIEVLKHVDASSPSAFSGDLRKALHTAVGKFASRSFTTEDRRELLGRLLPDIEQYSAAGTTAAEVLLILLQYQLPQEDAEVILAMLPVNTAVDDLQAFVSSNRTAPITNFVINSAIVRFSCVLRLMSLDTRASSEQTLEKLFEAMFGVGALGEYARAAAWDRLHSLTTADGAPVAAINLWRNAMQRYVPSLPTALVNPRLIDLICTYIQEECAKGSEHGDYGLLLQHPLWEALFRFATTCDDGPVVRTATTAITHLLLDYPAANAKISAFCDGAISCQTKFVRNTVRALKDAFDKLQVETTSLAERGLFRMLDMLHSILMHSRRFNGVFARATKHDALVLGPSTEESDRLSFTLQIYDTGPQPQIVSVEASKTATVLQLLGSLPSKTGAAANRVIAAGREITGLTTHTLEDAGVQDSGVIQIRPRYKQDFNFDHLLMSTGPVEKEVAAQFDSLEALVDGPSMIAEKAADFLMTVPPSLAARDRIASPSARAEQLFPDDNMARARFSINVLRWHLRDCARIGVADERFLAKGVQLLTSVLMDEGRDLLDGITPQVIDCLHAFLQERPGSDNPQQYFTDGPSFVTRMIARLLEIEARARTGAMYLAPIAGNAYDILLLAGQIDDTIWQSFSQSEHLITLHIRLLLSPNIGFSEGIAKPIRSLCQDAETPDAVMNTFWDVIEACLPDALEATNRSAVFFSLAPVILQTTDKVRTDETIARPLVQDLVTRLWGYRHIETANDLNTDAAMSGLLTLLRDAVIILKSFKKPLALEGLSSKVAEQLLFPDHVDQASRPLISDETRSLAYDILRLTLESSAEFERVVDVTEQIAEDGLKQVGLKFPGFHDWRRNPNTCAGLANLGMTCYMNSMLQQLFSNIQFRKFLLDLPLDYPEEQVLLRQLQNLFARMQGSVEPWQETTALADALSVSHSTQEDVHDFYASLLNRLEEEMPDANRKVALATFFTGQSITQVRGECGHVSARKEAFGDLSVTVKNKANLHESLAEFVQGEPLEGTNKYKCMSCDPENGRLVDAVRRTCLEDVPDSLTVCLKRFTMASKFMGEGKVNDRFDFPETIDMSLYKRTHLEAPHEPHEPDVFLLVGVIVHQGSLNLGHYWSHVRIVNPTRPDDGDWFCLEDSKATWVPNGFETIRQECCGGLTYANGTERPDNAYVLCYQRKRYIAEAQALCGGQRIDPKGPVGLPKVPLRESLALENRTMNAWRQRVAALFDAKYAHHVCWLLNQYPAFNNVRAGLSDSESVVGSLKPAERTSAHEAKVGALMTHYVLRVLLSDPSCEDKLSQLTSACKTALDARPSLAKHALDAFTVDAFGFEATLANDHFRVRRMVFELLKSCMTIVREHDHLAFRQTAETLLEMHGRLLDGNANKHPDADKYPHRWRDFLAMPSFVAEQGSQETLMVWRRGYFTWIIEIIWLRTDSNWKAKHRELWEHLQRDGVVDLDPLFAFLYNLLKDHVNLVDLDGQTDDDEGGHETAYGWSLSPLERNALQLQDNKVGPWSLLTVAHRHCLVKRRDIKDWRDYGFGKFLGLFVSEKSSPGLKDVISRSLAFLVEKEEHELTPLLFAILHYCDNTEDSQCKEVLAPLSKVLPEWGLRRNTLAFMQEAFTLAPGSVLDGVDKWVMSYLCEKAIVHRRATAVWLSDHVMVEQPLSDDDEIDARRARVARWLAQCLIEVVQQAYAREESKNAYEAVMDVLHSIAAYLRKLGDAVAQAIQEETTLPTQLMVEADESNRLMSSLPGFLMKCDDWESTEMELPTRPMGVRQSVEIEDTDNDVSDDDELMDEMDEFSQAV